MSDSYAFPAYEPMDVLIGVRARLIADTAFMAAITGGVFQKQAPAKPAPTAPYAIVDTLASDDNHGNKGFRYMNQGLVLVKVWGLIGDWPALKIGMVRADAVLSDAAFTAGDSAILRLQRDRPLPLPPDNSTQPTWYQFGAQWLYQAQALSATATA